jgi:hypothetical protein
VPWDQEWSVRLRVKSQTMAMLGEEIDSEHNTRRQENPAKSQKGQPPNNSDSPQNAADESPLKGLSLPNPANVLKGLFGR